MSARNIKIFIVPLLVLFIYFLVILPGRDILEAQEQTGITIERAVRSLNIGDNLFDEAKFEEALQLYRKALEFKNDRQIRIRTYGSLTAAYFKIGEHALAKVYCKKLLEEAPKSKWAADFLLKIQESLTAQKSSLESQKIVQHGNLGHQYHDGGKLDREVVKVFVQTGHMEGVNTLSISKDGRYLVSGDCGGTIKLWEIGSGKEVFTINGHSEVDHFGYDYDGVTYVGFTPEKDEGLSYGSDGTIRRWDFQTGKEKKSYKEMYFSSRFCGVTPFAMSNNTLYTIVNNYETWLCEFPSMKIISTLSTDPHDCLGIAVFSSDNKIAAFSRWDGITFLGLPSGEELKKIHHSGKIISMALSNDGAFALFDFFKEQNRIVQLMNISENEIVKTYAFNETEYPNLSSQYYKYAGSALRFNSEGNQAIISGPDHSLILIDVQTGAKLKTFKGHTHLVYSVKFLPDDKGIITASEDRTLKLWDLKFSRPIKTFGNHAEVPTRVLLEGESAYISKANSIEIWDISRGTQENIISGSFDNIIAFSTSKEYPFALVQDKKNEIYLLNILNRNLVGVFEGDAESEVVGEFSPNGKYLAFCKYKDNALFIYSLDKLKIVNRIFLPNDKIVKLKFSPDSNYLALGFTQESESIVKMWDLKKGGEYKPFLDNDGKKEGFHGIGTVKALAFSPNMKSLIASIYYYYPGYEHQEGQGKLFHWDVKSGQRKEMEIDNSINSIIPFPNDKFLLGREDGLLTLGAWEEPAISSTFKGHSHEISSLEYFKAKEYIFSTSHDLTTRVWNKQTGKELCKLVSFNDGEWISITPEGYYNASLRGAKHLNVRIGNKVYGIDQFEAIYYRPDIVQLALKLGDTQKAIAQLKGDTEGLKAEEQPPKIWFTYPATTQETDKSSINIYVKTEDIADTAESVTFFVNHRPLSTEKKFVRPAAPGAKIRQFSRRIPLAIGENWIEAVAKGRAGATESDKVLVIRKGKQKTLPELYYFGAGVSRHSEPALSLRYAAADVTGLADALKRQKGRVYSNVNVRILTDQSATRTNILDGVETFFADARQEDIAILFVSGHGMNGAAGYHFIAHDTNPDRLSSTGVPWTTFDEVLKTVKSSVLLLADTCHSGNIVGNQKWRAQAQADPHEFLRESAKSGVIVFASSSGNTVSIEDPTWGHGAFTKALIDGIMGQAAYKKDLVKLSFLQDYVRDTVMELTENTQQPVIPRLTGAGAFLDLVLARTVEIH